MPEPSIERFVSRVAYAARQGSRVAWYAGHGAVMRRMVRRIEEKLPDGERPRLRKPRGPVPSMSELLGDVGKLLRRDLAMIETGVYPAPAEPVFDPMRAIGDSRAFLRDVPAVARRRRQKDHRDVRRSASNGRRPRYFMQNFHFQTGGWMTDRSARLYDMQVEVLFSGAAAAMRRQALVPLARAMRGLDQRTLRYIDVGCGTGLFVQDVRTAFPRLPLLAIDLSEPYLRHAVASWRRDRFVAGIVAKAERLPIADDSFNLASVIYLFHELPPGIRAAVAQELGRILKPGGTLVIVDSLQPGDDPDKDGLLELFPQMFHEPYYRSYLKTDLDALFGSAGFERQSAVNAFLSRVIHYRKPD